MTGPTFPCEDCGRVFGGYRGFLDHRRGERCARSTRQLHNRGLHRNAAGIWVRHDPTGETAVLFPKTPVTSESTEARVDRRSVHNHAGKHTDAENAS